MRGLPKQKFAHSAFTLAEVLITLAIIGVVAALTIPTVINNYQKQQTVARLKKVYAEINQALQMAQAENGSIAGWGIEKTSNDLNRVKYFGDNYLFPYLKITKHCVPTSNNCWLAPASLTNYRGYLSNSETNNISFETASGYSVYYFVGPTAVQLWIDIDGAKRGKNMLGKDVFGFYFYWSGPDTGKLRGVTGVGVPTREGLKNSAQHGCSKEIKHMLAGRYCSSLIMFDGWQIKDDYPW